MNIHPAKDSDIDAIKSIVFTVLNEYGLESDSSGIDQDLDSIEQSYWSNGGYFGVVENAGEIIATLGLYKIDDTTCELRKMYALPSARGKGLGKFLMDFAISKARELEFERIVLETAAELKEAIGLYKKYGFEEFESDHLAARCDQAMQLLL